MQNQEVNLPKVGIIIANFNYSQWILDAIKSAVGQDYPNKEIYIIDDLSTDNSIEVVQNLRGSPDYTGDSILEDNEHYLYQRIGINRNCSIYLIALKQNGGPSRARNFGIRLAAQNQCQLFGVLDADDIWKQGKLSKSIMKILEDPEVIGGVYTDYQHFNVETNTLTYESKEAYCRMKLVQNCIIHSGCVINGLAFQKCGLYDEDLRVCEDYNLWLRFSNVFLFAHIAEDLVIVRVQPNNSTNTVSQERWSHDYQLAKQRAMSQ